MSERPEHRHHHHHHHRSGSSSGSLKKKYKRIWKKHKASIINVGLILLALLVIAIIVLSQNGLHAKKNVETTVQQPVEQSVITANAIHLEAPLFTKEICLVGASAQDYMSSSPGTAEKVIGKYREEAFVRQDVGYPVTLPFAVEGLPEGCNLKSIRVEVSEYADMSAPRVLDLKPEARSASIHHLKTGMQYYYRIGLHLADGNVTSVQGSFRTADTPRILSVDGIVNVRDVGGWKTVDGKTIRQGLLYRGSELDGAVEPAYKLSNSGLQTMLTVLGIKTELDLRSSSVNSVETHALGANVEHTYYSALMYDGCFTEEGKEAVRALFADLANERNYPAYMHCTYGADRTGTMCYLLGALLGMSEEDLIREYELSVLYHERVQLDQLQLLIDGLAVYDGDTIQEKVETYLLSVGVSAAQIAQIRQIFLA